MKVAVVGANGQLGADVVDALRTAGHEAAPLTHAEIEVSDAESVAAAIAELNPDAVINTSAFHNVELCEREPARAFAVNALGAKHLAESCARRNAYLLHISTDYVFNGAKQAPYLESDSALPLNTYGNTKLAGEHYVRAIYPDAAVMRVSGIYGINPCRAKGGLNFVKLMLKLAKERPEIRVVDDEILTPTYSKDAARQAVCLVETRAPGLFHATAQGQCSWHEFARYIFDKAGVPANLQKARPGEFPAKVPRPAYSVLENANLQARGIDLMPTWQSGLDRYLQTLTS